MKVIILSLLVGVCLAGLVVSTTCINYHPHLTPLKIINMQLTCKQGKKNKPVIWSFDNLTYISKLNNLFHLFLFPNILQNHFPRNISLRKQPYVFSAYRFPFFFCLLQYFFQNGNLYRFLNKCTLDFLLGVGIAAI